MLPSEPVIASGGCWHPSACPHVVSWCTYLVSHAFGTCPQVSLCYLFLGLVLSHPVMSTLCDPMDCSPLGFSVHGILQARIWCGFPFPPPGALPDPGIKPTSPALQADSLPAEPLHAPISPLASWTVHSLTSETNLKSLCESFGSLHKKIQFFMTVDLPSRDLKLGCISGNHLGSFKNDLGPVSTSKVLI